MSIGPGSLDILRALMLGFAFAGLVASTYEMLAGRRLGFGLLRGGGMAAVAAVPILLFAAPFVIMRNLLRDRTGGSPSAVFTATMMAGIWGLLCGRLVLDAAMRLLGA